MSIASVSAGSIALTLLQRASPTPASPTPSGQAKPAGLPGLGVSGGSQSLLARNSEAMATIMRLVEGGTTSGVSAARAAGETKWEAGAPYGDPTRSDAELLKAGVDRHLLNRANDFDEMGLPPEAGQALRDAVKNGTLKFQKASEVADLNYHQDVRFTKSSIGGGYDCFTSHGHNATGAPKEAIAQGKAVVMWTADRGGIYITW